MCLLLQNSLRMMQCSMPSDMYTSNLAELPRRYHRKIRVTSVSRQQVLLAQRQSNEYDGMCSTPGLNIRRPRFPVSHRWQLHSGRRLHLCRTHNLQTVRNARPFLSRRPPLDCQLRVSRSVRYYFPRPSTGGRRGRLRGVGVLRPR